MHGDVTDTWYMPDMQQKGWIGKLVLEQEEDNRISSIFHSASSLPKTRRAGEEIMAFFAEHQEARTSRASWLEDRRK